MSQSPRCWKVTVDPELGQDLSGNPAAKAAPLSHEALSVTKALPATGSSSASKQRDSDGNENDGTVNAEEDGDEGDVRAWLAILGSFLVYFASFGVANSFGYFQTFYQLEYLPDSSPSVISFIGTIQITLLYLTGSVAGALFDSYGFKVRALLINLRRVCLRLSANDTLLNVSISTQSRPWAAPDHSWRRHSPSQEPYGSSSLLRASFLG